MGVFVCQNEAGGTQTLVDAADHLRAAERYAEGVGLPKGDTMIVRWRSVRHDTTGTAFVAHGGEVFASEDGYVFTPQLDMPWFYRPIIPD